MFDFMPQGQVSINDLENAIKELPLPEKIKVTAIYKRYKKIREIEDQMKKVCRQNEKKYLKLDEPVLRNASEIINGKRALNKEEIKEPEKYLTPEEIQKIGENLGPRKIEGYWSKCLSQSSVIKNGMGSNDLDLLKFIQNIYVVDEEGTDNFTIIFDLAENDVVSNTKLEKKFILKDDMPIKSQGTKIQWKGKNLCMKEVKKKQKNKKTGQQRVVTKTVESKSFFNFFRSVEGSQNLNPLQMNEQQIQLQEKLDEDFQIGGIIVDEILPYSLEYYLQIEHDDDMGDDDMDDQDNDEDEDEADDNEGKKKKGKKQEKSKSKSKSKGKPAEVKTATKGQQKPQCKQQ